MYGGYEIWEKVGQNVANVLHSNLLQVIALKYLSEILVCSHRPHEKLGPFRLRLTAKAKPMRMARNHRSRMARPKKYHMNPNVLGKQLIVFCKSTGSKGRMLLYIPLFLQSF